jgi:hypothetical protein
MDQEYILAILLANAASTFIPKVSDTNLNNANSSPLMVIGLVFFISHYGSVAKIKHIVTQSIRLIYKYL